MHLFGSSAAVAAGFQMEMGRPESQLVGAASAADQAVVLEIQCIEVVIGVRHIQ